MSPDTRSASAARQQIDQEALQSSPKVQRPSIEDKREEYLHDSQVDNGAASDNHRAACSSHPSPQSTIRGLAPQNPLFNINTLLASFANQLATLLAEKLKAKLV